MKNVIIAMAIGGVLEHRNNILNVLYSIKNQNDYHKHNIKLCIFNDGCDESWIWKIVEQYFEKKEVIYSESKEPVGFQLLCSHIGKVIPAETDVVFYQTSDAIWYDKDMLSTGINETEKENCVITARTINMVVDENLYEKPKEFYKTLDTTFRSLRTTPQGRVLLSRKPSKYMYLGAMRPEVFVSLAQEPFLCDIIQRRWFTDNKIPFREVKNLAVHQHHKVVAYPCSSLPECPNKYQCRRKRHPRLRNESIEAARRKNSLKEKEKNK